jgi:ABC-type multidrug transport system fused ATPase/permease subunit
MTTGNISVEKSTLKLEIYALIFAILAMILATWSGVFAGYGIRQSLVHYSRYHSFSTPDIIYVSIYLLALFALLTIAITYLALFVNHLLKLQSTEQVSKNRK